MTDRDRLIELLNQTRGTYFFAGDDNLNLLADHLLAKSVVKVVRCKDCKYWLNGYCEGIPFCGDDASYVETEEDDFCSYGELKEREG